MDPSEASLYGASFCVYVCEVSDKEPPMCPDMFYIFTINIQEAPVL